MKISNQKFNQAGDTIVEVLFALLIVAVAIGIAYRVSTSSLSASRQAQERTIALKHVEGQIELIKTIVATPGATQAIYAPDTVYCINTSVPYDLKRVNASAYGSEATIKDLASDTLNTATLQPYQPECVIDGLYHLSIESNSSQFTVVARWFRFGSTAKDEVKLVYRIYQ